MRPLTLLAALVGGRGLVGVFAVDSDIYAVNCEHRRFWDAE